MTNSNIFNKYFVKWSALKKIGNSFSKLFAITKIEEPCMKAGSLMNQKWSIAVLET